MYNDSDNKRSLFGHTCIIITSNYIFNIYVDNYTCSINKSSNRYTYMCLGDLIRVYS